jgi:hypothetical protein
LEPPGGLCVQRALDGAEVSGVAAPRAGNERMIRCAEVGKRAFPENPRTLVISVRDVVYKGLERMDRAFGPPIPTVTNRRVPIEHLAKHDGKGASVEDGMMEGPKHAPREHGLRDLETQRRLREIEVPQAVGGQPVIV